MDIVHCNFCFSHPDPQNNKFFLTSCGHMLCGGCSNEPTAKCKVCKQSCRFIQLSKEMPEELKFYFSDMDKETRKLLKIIYFQLRSCKIFIQEYVPQMENKYNALKNAYKEQALKFEAARNEITAIETKNRMLQTEVNDLKRHLNSYNESEISTYGVTVPNRARYHEVSRLPLNKSGSADLMEPHFYSSRGSDNMFTPTAMGQRQYVHQGPHSHMENFLTSPASGRTSSTWAYQPQGSRSEFYSKQYF